MTGVRFPEFGVYILHMLGIGPVTWQEPNKSVLCAAAELKSLYLVMWISACSYWKDAVSFWLE